MLRKIGGAPENDEDFWRNLDKREVNCGQGFEVKLKVEKTWRIFASVFMGDSKTMEYFYNISLNIGRVCFKDNPPCEFPQFKWIEDPYSLFRRVFKINDMMA